MNLAMMDARMLFSRATIAGLIIAVVVTKMAMVKIVVPVAIGTVYYHV